MLPYCVPTADTKTSLCSQVHPGAWREAHPTVSSKGVQSTDSLAVDHKGSYASIFSVLV